MEDLENRTFDILFDVRRSVRYHLYRQKFFEQFHTISTVLNFLAGSSAVTLILAYPDLKLIAASFSILIVILSTIDVVVGTTRKSTLHSDLAVQFINLEKQISPEINLDDEKYEKLRQRKLDIEMREPPILRLLDVVCYFEVYRSLGGEAREIPKINLIRKWTKQLFGYSTYALTLSLIEKTK